MAGQWNVDYANTAYRALVWAFKKGSLDDNLTAKKCLTYRNITVSEHPPDSNPSCEWNTLHYHAIVQHPVQYRFDVDKQFLKFKDSCSFFKSEQCKLPQNFMAYIMVPPRHIVFRQHPDWSTLPMLEDDVTPELIQEVKERKEKRFETKMESGKDISNLKDLIVKTSAQTEAELIELMHSDSKFQEMYYKRTWQNNFKKALTIAQMQVKDTPFYELAESFQDTKGQCISVKESTELLKDWCKFQNIDPTQFLRDIYDLMDQKLRKKNTLYLRGAPNSGKSYIARSLCKASRFFGQISQGTAGYAFMWQDCLNKRLIEINEPYIDDCMIEQLKMVMEGLGCFVHKKNCADDWLRPTPVIVTSNPTLWTRLSHEEAIRPRLIRYYENLKEFKRLKYVTGDLHPGCWKQLYDELLCPTSPAIDTVAQEQISKHQTKQADPSTHSTQRAENTTNTTEKETRPTVIVFSKKRRISTVDLVTSSDSQSPGKDGFTQHLTPHTPKQSSQEQKQAHDNIVSELVNKPLRYGRRDLSVKRPLCKSEDSLTPPRKRHTSTQESLFTPTPEGQTPRWPTPVDQENKQEQEEEAEEPVQEEDR